jgi:hypothetical protein
LLAGRTYEGVHDLYDLFLCLDQKDQDAIRDLWNKEQRAKIQGQVLAIYEGMKKNNPDAPPDAYDAILNHPEEITFEFVMKSGRAAFAQVRYYYEGVQAKPGDPFPAWYAPEIVLITRRVILQAKPEWAIA